MSFHGADLRFANFQRCLFTKCDFSNSIVIGTDFQHARFSDDCIFDNTIGDISTEFQNAQTLRPYSKLELFQYFEFKRGTLLRRTDNTEQSNATDIQAARASIHSALAKFELIELNGGVVSESPQIGHNNPPREFRISEAEIVEARETLQEMDLNLKTKGVHADRELLKKAINVSTRVITHVAMYISHQADTLISEFSKSAGATLGSKTGLAATALLLSGELTSLVNALRAIAGF